MLESVGRGGAIGRPAGALAAAALWIASAAPAPAAAEGAPAKLPSASVHFEQNATDGDVEVVFRAKGGREGLAKLRVVGPDGRPVIDFSAPDASTLGIREFELESPEPKDVAALRAAYPEGVYTFTAATASGREYRGESTLRHALPETTGFVRPEAGARGVPARDLVIRWSAVAEVSGYIVELEQDDLGVSLRVHLPATVTSLRVPDTLLHPGVEYDLGIATVSAGGNVSFVETSFTTAD